jgi:hypothetical protein
VNPGNDDPWGRRACGRSRSRAKGGAANRQRRDVDGGCGATHVPIPRDSHLRNGLTESRVRIFDGSQPALSRHALTVKGGSPVRSAGQIHFFDVPALASVSRRWRRCPGVDAGVRTFLSGSAYGGGMALGFGVRTTFSHAGPLFPMSVRRVESVGMAERSAPAVDVRDEACAGDDPGGLWESKRPNAL